MYLKREWLLWARKVRELFNSWVVCVCVCVCVCVWRFYLCFVSLCFHPFFLTLHALWFFLFQPFLLLLLLLLPRLIPLSARFSIFSHSWSNRIANILHLTQIWAEVDFVLMNIFTSPFSLSGQRLISYSWTFLYLLSFFYCSAHTHTHTHTHTHAHTPVGLNAARCICGDNAVVLGVVAERAGDKELWNYTSKHLLRLMQWKNEWEELLRK